MSTKITICCSHEKGEEFHLYKECFEETGDFYLKLKTPDYFEASPNSITVKIPEKIFLKIWKLKKKDLKKGT